ncbi:MAG: hypothetical protein JO266_22300 [Acidobacteria bacterium]|nr:hypothetical protein [Acidobacteriota bacterium]
MPGSETACLPIATDSAFPRLASGTPMTQPSSVSYRRDVYAGSSGASVRGAMLQAATAPIATEA